MPSLIEAEFAVRQLHARYADAVWRKDAAAFAACFAEDALWKIGGRELAGRAEIAAGFAALTARIERTLMTFRTPLVALAPLSARTYVTEQNKYRDGSAASTIGIYHERFAEDEADGLRFAWRQFDLCYFGPADLSAPFHPGTDPGPAPAMPAADAPTVSSAWWAASPSPS